MSLSWHAYDLLYEGEKGKSVNHRLSHTADTERKREGDNIHRDMHTIRDT